MAAKPLAFCINFGRAIALVFLCCNSLLFAQDDPVDDTLADPAAQSSSMARQLSIQLSGTGAIRRVGNLTVDPAVFDTGLVDVGQSVSGSVNLTHTGEVNTDPVNVKSVQVIGADASEFTVDFAGFITLTSGDSQKINLQFTPLVTGAKSAALRLEIEGATVPYMLMIEGSARFPLTSTLESASSVIDFGQIVQSKNSTKTLSVTNTAIEADAPVINLLSLELTGDTPAAFSHNFTPATLSPGESMSYKLVMQDQDAPEGRKSALATIAHDGVNKPVVVALEGDVVEPKAVPVNFSISALNGTDIKRGTALQFGPDGKLYVTQMSGKILVYRVQRNAKNNYSASLLETLNLIYNTPNHDDDGTLNSAVVGRLITGILVTGSAAKPIIFTQSSDPRQGAGPSGIDKNLDTNSGILHKLVKNGNTWNKIDLVRGLPRSEENHASNGLVLMGNKLLALQGGHTNMGAPSNNFALTSEYALSGAILEFDLNALGNATYDLPTLDDEDRPGAADNNDPFGGNDGQNQAILENNGPVDIYAPGFRNAYDLVLTEAGKLYTSDNGPNAGWGGTPMGDCTNNVVEPGKTYVDALHHISNKGYYGGHPNPVRGNKNNTFNVSNPQSPIEGAANPLECQYKIPKTEDGALTLFPASSNGMDEYTASNFGSAMQGDLVIAHFGKRVSRVQLNANGTAVTSKSDLKTNVGGIPLDVVAQGDSGPFPGTIWIVDNGANLISVLEPADY